MSSIVEFFNRAYTSYISKPENTIHRSAIQRGDSAIATQIHRLESDDNGDEVCPIPKSKVKYGAFWGCGILCW